MDFKILEPLTKEMSTLWLAWETPEEGSTGELEHFEVYRDDALIATLGSDVYEYEDTISVGVQAEYYILSVYSDGCEAASETLIGEGVPNSVNEMGNSILAYPNPSNGTFNLNLGEGQWKVEVYDITGRKVYENQLDGHSVLDLDQCQKGIYFLKATGETRGMTAKIVIQ